MFAVYFSEVNHKLIGSFSKFLKVKNMLKYGCVQQLRKYKKKLYVRNKHLAASEWRKIRINRINSAVTFEPINFQNNSPVHKRELSAGSSQNLLFLFLFFYSQFHPALFRRVDELNQIDRNTRRCKIEK